MDVIIVGAGPAGLTLGAALARRRHRVVAVDRRPRPGTRRILAASRRDAVRTGTRVPSAGARPAAGDMAGGLGRLARSRCRAVRDAGAWSLHGGRRGAVPSSHLRASSAAGGGRGRRADRRRRPCGAARRGGRARRGRGGGRHDPSRRSRGRRQRSAVPVGTAAGRSAPTPAWPTCPGPTGGAATRRRVR